MHALTTAYNEMNQMKRDRKSWKDIRIQVSLCKMNKFIGTWTALTAIIKRFYFVTFAQLFVLGDRHLVIDIQKRSLCPLSTNI